MTKRIAAIMIVLFGMACFSACAGEGAGAGKTADLAEFYERLAEEYELPEMTAVTDDTLERYYPGLGGIEYLQSVVKIPKISSVVNEYVFLQCAAPEAAEAAVEILQARIDGQASGGAWYPALAAAWGMAQVVRNGNYVAMISAGEDTEKIVSEWNALFE